MYGIFSWSSMRAKLWPERPKPQMTTWFSLRTLLEATRVNASDCSNHSLLAKRIAMRSLYSIRNGAQNMEINIAANTAWLKVGSIRSRPSIWLSKTKPNSPAWAKHKPVLMEMPGLEPKLRDSKAIRPNLKMSGPTSKTKTNIHCSRMTLKSSNMPIVTKKRPSKTSRNGLISSSTWWR